MVFRTVNGKKVVSIAPDPEVCARNHKMRMEEQGNVYDSYRLNLSEFTAASKIGCDIYTNLKGNSGEELGPIFRPYSQNELTRSLKEGAWRDLKGTPNGFFYATEFTFYVAQRALRGLDLSQDTAPGKAIRMIPLGPQHNPTAVKVLGLSRAANQVGANGNSQLEFRFHIRQSNIGELIFCPRAGKWRERNEVLGLPEAPRIGNNGFHHSEPTGWIPTDILTDDGITLKLPAWDPQAKYCTAIMIEWRELKKVGRRIVRHHSKGIVRIATVHGPAEAYDPEGTQSHKMQKAPTPAPHPADDQSQAAHRLAQGPQRLPRRRPRRLGPHITPAAKPPLPQQIGNHHSPPTIAVATPIAQSEQSKPPTQPKRQPTPPRSLRSKCHSQGSHQSNGLHQNTQFPSLGTPKGVQCG
jgi:hypothetical protein